MILLEQCIGTEVGGTGHVSAFVLNKNVRITGKKIICRCNVPVKWSLYPQFMTSVV